jgi:hypothetical protein
VTSVDTLFHLREEYFIRTPEIDPLIPASEPATDGMTNERGISSNREGKPAHSPSKDHHLTAF